MGARSRRKGARIEREMVHLHREAGIAAERVPLSGSAGGSFTGDLIVAGDLRGEVKGRANGEGFATLERWLGSNDLLFLRRDRAAPFVVLPWSIYARILKAAVSERTAGTPGSSVNQTTKRSDVQTAECEDRS